MAITIASAYGKLMTAHILERLNAAKDTTFPWNWFSLTKNSFVTWTSENKLGQAMGLDIFELESINHMRYNSSKP